MRKISGILAVALIISAGAVSMAAAQDRHTAVGTDSGMLEIDALVHKICIRIRTVRHCFPNG